MKTKIIKLRIGAIQFGVTSDITKNVEQIKKGINWAHENRVNYIITPEVALSGYAASEFSIHTCETVEKAMDELVNYASMKSVGLIIGTFWLEDKETRDNKGLLGKKYNQIRVYSPRGEFVDKVSKTHIVSFDMDCVAGEKPPIVEITYNNTVFKIGILICNDLAGNYWTGGKNLSKVIQEKEGDVIVHCSNSAKDFMNDGEKEIHDNFHSSVTKFMSYASNIPFISVDSSNNITGIDGNFETSYPSGVYLPLETKYAAPRKGTDYFYFDVEKIKIINVEGEV